ncbi:antichymotrypsin-2-like [Nylanderia fulva]|uniref:antichymotrypsin-2-like n=1 Tax=Nylanderia fulva TaxID=613905 RepID=UPI0010FAFA4C|nr:antichymotrypsin-2-like [Nylanderia fulva]XP_029165424.1 antichymotrypsin-2-like [Nylanderia fulva]
MMFLWKELFTIIILIYSVSSNIIDDDINLEMFSDIFQMFDGEENILNVQNENANILIEQVEKENILINKQDDFDIVSTLRNNFTSFLHTSVLSANPDKNVIVCSLNIYTMLSLLSTVADKNTGNNLKSILNINSEIMRFDDFLYEELRNHLHKMRDEIQSKNAVYIHYRTIPDTNFALICKRDFKCYITITDFSSVRAIETINSLIWNAMKMSNVISPEHIDQDTKFLLVNTMRFKSSWLRPFNEINNWQGKFHVSKTEKYLVPLMLQNATYNYGTISSWRSRFIEIPYLNSDLAMIILLPNKRINLQTLENNFKWQTLRDSKRYNKSLTLALPKFKVATTVDLKDILRKIGVNIDCGHECEAELNSVNILQHIVIEVNERGSHSDQETAYEEDIYDYNKLFSKDKDQFYVCRPFMFVVEYKPLRVPLFLGSIRNLKDITYSILIEN